jgi:pimeloyl-ACP methyl ester carboxylesterase
MPKNPAILYFHGNGENLAFVSNSGLFQSLEKLGGPFLAIDYPGYGRSTGTPSENSLKAAGCAGLDWLDQKYPDRPKILIGFSLGSAVAFQVAAANQDRINGLVVLAPWTSLHAAAAVSFPIFLVKLLVPEEYDSLKAARSLKIPVLVVHGKADTIIPIRQGRQIAAALKDKLFLPVKQTGHNDLPGTVELWQAVDYFIFQYLKAKEKS